MIMNYPEYNNVTFRFEYPFFSTSVVFEGHENLWLADCVSDDIGLSRMLDNKPFVEPKAEIPARQPRLMRRCEPARPSGTNSEAFFSLRD